MNKKRAAAIMLFLAFILSAFFPVYAIGDIPSSEEIIEEIENTEINIIENDFSENTSLELEDYIVEENASTDTKGSQADADIEKESPVQPKAEEFAESFEITITYIDIETERELIERYVSDSMPLGTAYNVREKAMKTIDGYEFLDYQGLVEGEISENIYIYSYYRVSGEPSPPSEEFYVSVIYRNVENDEIIADPHISGPYKMGTEYDVSEYISKDINGYEYVSSSAEAFGEVLEDIEIFSFYRKTEVTEPTPTPTPSPTPEETPRPEVTPNPPKEVVTETEVRATPAPTAEKKIEEYKITILYVDKESGKEIDSSYISEPMEKDTEYDVTKIVEKKIKDYEFVEYNGEVKGKITKDIEITSYYKKKEIAPVAEKTEKKPVAPEKPEEIMEEPIAVDNKINTGEIVSMVTLSIELILAAVLAISIFSDLKVIRWYNNKKKQVMR